ncbi:MAG: acyl-CoA dehydrogenase family protein, partial [Acidimicrobiia bacterium]
MSEVGVRGEPTGAEEDLGAFRDEARAFLKSHAAPRTRGPGEFTWGQGADRVGLFHEPSPDEESDAVARSREWRRLRFDAGFGWITGPMEYGGRALPDTFERAYGELERGYDTPSQRLVVGPEVMAPALVAHASPEQKSRWLPGMYRGDLIACLLFSEPEAGSDLAGVTTSAARTDGSPGVGSGPPAHWEVSGQKVWTSGAHYADLGLLLART